MMSLGVVPDGAGVCITLYRWAGRKLFWKIKSECEECDLSVHLIDGLLEKEFNGAPVEFEVKNWLDHLFESLGHGGWHAPVILINGKRFTQGTVPPRAKLIQKIEELLGRSRALCPVCGELLSEEEDYSSHRKYEARRRVIRFIQARHPEWSEAEGICTRCLEDFQRRLQQGELIV